MTSIKQRHYNFLFISNLKETEDVTPEPMEQGDFKIILTVTKGDASQVSEFQIHVHQNVSDALSNLMHSHPLP